MPNKAKRAAKKQKPKLADLQGRMAFKPDEAAVILGINQFTIYRLINRGLLKSSSSLRHKLISRTEIERFLVSTTN